MVLQSPLGSRGSEPHVSAKEILVLAARAVLNLCKVCNLISRNEVCEVLWTAELSGRYKSRLSKVSIGEEELSNTCSAHQTTIVSAF